MKSNNLYYKIAARNKNGTLQSSNIVNLYSKNVFDVSIYPVPVVDVVNINVEDKNAQIYLLSSTGQIIKSEKSESNIHQFNVIDLANGLYLIKVISSNGYISIHRFNKVGK
jgi:Secretion system C-terminal sorting domain